MKKLLCKILGHKYYIYAIPKEEWGKNVKWLHCERCYKSFAMHDGVRALLPMDVDLMKMHEWDFVGLNETEANACNRELAKDFVKQILQGKSKDTP